MGIAPTVANTIQFQPLNNSVNVAQLVVSTNWFWSCDIGKPTKEEQYSWNDFLLGIPTQFGETFGIPDDCCVVDFWTSATPISLCAIQLVSCVMGWIWMKFE